MQSTVIKSKIEAEINRYSQQFDIIQGPQIRHQFSLFLDETKDLPDNEFLQKVNERYGFLLDFRHRQKILGYLIFLKYALLYSLLFQLFL